MRRLLRTAAWDADAVRDDVRGFVVARLGDAAGVLICDETGFLKKGTGSVGCSANTAAPLGGSRTPRSACSSATPRRGAGADRPPGYLPKSWTGDRPRCTAAGIPADRQFATKPELALEVITSGGGPDTRSMGGQRRGLW